MSIAICGIAKNENLYVREWVEYHKYIGVEKIFIYDNNDIDGEHLEEVLYDYIPSFVEIINVRGIEKESTQEDGLILQNHCYVECYNNHKSEYDYMAFIDIDEFINTRNKDINEVLSSYNNFDTLLLSWKNHGDNGLVRYDNRPVRERFTGGVRSNTGFRNNKCCKSIVHCGNKDIIISPKASIRHKFLFKDGINIDSTGKIIKEINHINAQLLSPVYGKLYIDHYITKTLEEYLFRYYNRVDSSSISKKRKFLLVDVINNFYKFNYESAEKSKVFKEFKDKSISINDKYNLLKEKYNRSINKEEFENKQENDKLLDKSVENNDIYLDGISICISAYKASNYIKETLDSISNQSWFKNHDNWECIIGIDGCNITLDYIKAIMNMYDSNHFSFYMMDSSQGTYITSNTLMGEIAKYNWVLRFDSDDIMHENMIETIINNIDNNTDIIRFHLQNFADKNYTLNDISKINKAYISYGQICVKHIKFNRYGGYLPWKCSADAEFLSRTRRFLKQKKLQDILFDRRITNDSLTNSSLTNDKSEIRKHYNEYINKISFNAKLRSEAINKDFRKNTYHKVTPYELIVSLTSFPQRITYVKQVVKSIIDTNIDKEIYKLVVVLSTEEFINKENDLPEDLVNYCNDNNIEILWYNRNIRSHKKLIPVIKKYPSLPVLVIDDDIIRTPEWFKMFINDRRKYPEDILCMRCDDYITDTFECIHDRSNFEDGVKFEDIIYHNRPSNGCGGTLYPPYTFKDQIFFDEDLIMKLSPSSDEMWQFCFNIMNNQIIRRTSNMFDIDSIKGTQKISLYKENKGKYTEIMNTLLNYFPKYKLELSKKLNSEKEINNYKAIVALTSWKKRINTVYKTIKNLLTFASNNYKIVLTLSIEEFPNKENDLPINLLSLLSNSNFEILWVRKNYKVFKKILFAMGKYKNLPIISADDDIIYKYNYLDELYNEWLHNKKYIISEGYEIHYTLNNELFKFSKGCATLFPPGSLLDSIKYLNEEIINTQNDDSFYGIYCHLNDIKIKYIHNNINSLIIPHTNDDAITIGVKTKDDFLKDKLIILKNIQQYKEV